MDLIHALVPHKLSFVSSLSSSVGVCTFRTISHWLLSTIYDILSLTNSNLTSADSCMYEKACP
jgi:hypothetical protein